MAHSLGRVATHVGRAKGGGCPLANLAGHASLANKAGRASARGATSHGASAIHQPCPLASHGPLASASLVQAQMALKASSNGILWGPEPIIQYKSI